VERIGRHAAAASFAAHAARYAGIVRSTRSLGARGRCRNPVLLVQQVSQRRTLFMIVEYVESALGRCERKRAVQAVPRNVPPASRGVPSSGVPIAQPNEGLATGMKRLPRVPSPPAIVV